MATKYTRMARARDVEGSLCHYCRAPMYSNDPQRMPTREHRVPMSRRGARSGPNVVWACYLCNHTKGNMTDAEFMEWRQRGRPRKVDYLREIGLIDPCGTPLCR